MNDPYKKIKVIVKTLERVSKNYYYIIRGDFMAGQIRVSPDTLQTGANDYGKASSDVNTILSNLSNLQEQLRSKLERFSFPGL